MAKTAPVVAVVIGSDSDWPVMKETAALLDTLGIRHEVRLLSAHRTPAAAAQFARGAEKSGLRVLIAAAGGAAHLAGVLASWTTLPVIGVPLEGWALGGLDALLSTMQMPAGIPVATVAIGKAGARNAAILAAEILALNDAPLAARIKKMRRDAAAGIAVKGRALAKEARRMSSGKAGKG